MMHILAETSQWTGITRKIFWNLSIWEYTVQISSGKVHVSDIFYDIIGQLLSFPLIWGGYHDCMVVGFTTTYAISGLSPLKLWV